MDNTASNGQGWHGTRPSFTFFIQASLACDVRLIETFLRQIDDWECSYSERTNVIKARPQFVQ